MVLSNIHSLQVTHSKQFMFNNHTSSAINYLTWMFHPFIFYYFYGKFKVILMNFHVAIVLGIDKNTKFS